MKRVGVGAVKLDKKSATEAKLKSEIKDLKAENELLKTENEQLKAKLQK